MRFRLTIECDNAAFADDDGELARLVLKVARDLDDRPPTSGDSGTVYDTNGNRVGEWTVTADAGRRQIGRGRS